MMDARAGADGGRCWTWARAARSWWKRMGVARLVGLPRLRWMNSSTALSWGDAGHGTPARWVSRRSWCTSVSTDEAQMLRERWSAKAAIECLVGGHGASWAVAQMRA